MMRSPLDFNAALGEQLRDAAEQMRAMRKPQKKQDKDPALAKDLAPVDGQARQIEAQAELQAEAQAELEVTAAVPATTVEHTARQRDGVTARLPDDATGGATVGVTHADSGATKADTVAVGPAVTAAARDTALTPDPTVAPTHTASAAQAVSRETLSPAQLHHAGLAGQDKNTSPELPDAASELWAMSQHSATPTLSERSWSGGVRGAVLDALRLLAGDNTHVLVNLKRLATHTGISYGSVRNAMSRLTRSGDIRTRQIRMADGHGVKVEFLTAAGQEGLAPLAPGEEWGRPTPPAVAQTVAQTVPLAGVPTGTTTDTTTVAQAVGEAVTQAGPHAPYSVADGAYPAGQLASGLAGQLAGQLAGHPAGHPVLQLAGHPAGQLTSQLAGPTADGLSAEGASQSKAFWQTTGQLFALAWPHVAEAGLGMDDLRALAPIFAVQGFDPTVLPRCLRYLDWELEHLDATENAEARRKDCVDLFMRGLQRRGSWPRPKDYPEEA